MKVLKRFVGCVLSLTLAFSIVGCKDNDSSSSSSESNASSSIEEVEVTPQKSLLDTIDILQNSNFTDTRLTDTAYGLSDEGNVGVIEGEYTQRKYPIPDDNAFQGEIIDWSDYSFNGNSLAKLKDILHYAKEVNVKGTKVKLNMPEDAVINLDISEADTGHFAIWIEDLNGFLKWLSSIRSFPSWAPLLRVFAWASPSMPNTLLQPYWP